MRAAGRCAVITGGASGLGAAAAAHLVAEGAHVVLSDIDAQRVSDVARTLDPQGTRVNAVAYDVTNSNDLANLIQQAERFFDRPIDIFLANAGMGFSGSLLEATGEQIRDTIAVNATGSLLSAQAALRSLTKASSSSLIFTCSLQRGYQDVRSAVSILLANMPSSGWSSRSHLSSGSKASG